MFLIRGFFLTREGLVPLKNLFDELSWCLARLVLSIIISIKIFYPTSNASNVNSARPPLWSKLKIRYATEQKPNLSQEAIIRILTPYCVEQSFLSFFASRLYALYVPWMSKSSDGNNPILGMVAAGCSHSGFWREEIIILKKRQYSRNHIWSYRISAHYS